MKLGQKQRNWHPFIVRRNKKIIVLAGAAVLMVPAIALAKGPIVRVGESLWEAVLAAIRLAF